MSPDVSSACKVLYITESSKENTRHQQMIVTMSKTIAVAAATQVFLTVLLVTPCCWTQAFQQKSFPERLARHERSLTVHLAPGKEPKSPWWDIQQQASNAPSPLFSVSAADPTSTSSEWTKKRVHNTAAFRSLSLLGVLALAGFTSRASLPSQVMATLHLLSFATWFGSVAYTTFIAGITMFKNLPRQTFGKLQAKLFPKYFSLGSITLVLQLITASVLPSAIKPLATKTLALALVMNLSNQLYLEPKSTDNMMRRYELEGQSGGQETEEYKTLKASFGKFHGMSSLTNLIALCAGVFHAVVLSRMLVS